jgi:TrmH family RNA methyltransferase
MKELLETIVKPLVQFPDEVNVTLTEREESQLLELRVNPSDMGNMGTIIRTAIGFGVNDIAVIEPCVDYFNPKVVRASMGACFSANICRFENFEQYKHVMGKRDCYPFMLKGATELQKLSIDKSNAFSLIFGNEATGLPDQFAEEGRSVLIRHKDTIDSLNLSMAVGIALYEFMK